MWYLKWTDLLKKQQRRQKLNWNYQKNEKKSMSDKRVYIMNKHKGTTVDSFLEEEGILESIEAVAVKRVIAYELEKKMKKDHLNNLK